jgi:pimeloyl-ACP methyl ester carboxylesterase
LPKKNAANKTAGLMMQTIRYKNDYLLSYTEYGNKSGYPLLIQHGLIASILDYGIFQRLIDFGFRLVCIARPGYGQSSPYCMQNIAEWGEIVSCLVDELKLSQFDVFGMSSGAPYSYSLGCRFSDKLRNIYIFSGIPALHNEGIASYWPHEIKRNASINEMKKVAQDVFFSGITGNDLTRNDIKDSMANDCFGIAQDLIIRAADWGFSLSDVTPPVFIRHSRNDGGVPCITAQMTSKLLPDCRFEIMESDVHFSEETLDDFIKEVILPQMNSGL